MKRETFQYKLKDGKEYTFSERNKEDVDYSYLYGKIRAYHFKFLQENVTSEEIMLPLLMQEMNKVYSGYEISEYLAMHPEHYQETVYNSFKIANPEVSIDDFKKICDEGTAKLLLEMISKIEIKQELNESEIAEVLHCKKELIERWKTEQPELYRYLSHSLKKKESVSVPKKAMH